MGILTNGTPTIDEGATLWRSVVNAIAAIIDNMVGGWGRYGMDVQVAVTGDIDGSNQTFTTPKAYQSGTLQVFVNGQQQPKTHPAGTAALVETDDSTGEFQLTPAPDTGAIIEATYIKAEA